MKCENQKDCNCITKADRELYKVLEDFAIKEIYIAELVDYELWRNTEPLHCNGDKCKLQDPGHVYCLSCSWICDSDILLWTVPRDKIPSDCIINEEVSKVELREGDPEFLEFYKNALAAFEKAKKDVVSAKKQLEAAERALEEAAPNAKLANVWFAIAEKRQKIAQIEKEINDLKGI